MRVGFVGAGAIAEHHLSVLSEQPDVDVAAICDVDAARADLVAERSGARAFTRWREMLDTGELDALFVCTPPAHHAAPAIAAFQRGLAVYIEKPLARSAADGEAIVAAWQRSGAVCAIGYQWRSLDVVHSLRSVLRGTQPGMLISRSFGPTEGARHDLEQQVTWFADPAAGGGLLFELASHDIDLQIALAGPVESVQATADSGRLALAGRPPTPLDDAVSVLLRFAGGGLGACHVAWSTVQSPPLYTLDVHAAGVALQLELDPVFELHGRARDADVSILGTVHPRTSSVTYFLEAARRHEPAFVPCSPADSLATLRALLASERAIASGACVAV